MKNKYDYELPPMVDVELGEIEGIVDGKDAKEVETKSQKVIDEVVEVVGKAQ